METMRKKSSSPNRSKNSVTNEESSMSYKLEPLELIDVEDETLNNTEQVIKNFNVFILSLSKKFFCKEILNVKVLLETQ